MKDRLKTKLYDKIFCVLLSVFLVLAYSFEKTNTAQLITKNFISLVVSLAIILLLSAINICGLGYCKYLFGRFFVFLEKKKKSDTKLEKIFSKHPFLFSFVIIILFWLPYAIIRFPLVSEWDAYHQIIQGLGMMEINYVWPIASTYFMSSIVKVGEIIFGSYDAGAFFLVFVQMLICAGCLAYSIKIINKFKINPCFKWIVLAIYSIATIYPRYLTAIVKDSLFSCLVVLFISIQLDIFVLKNCKLFNLITLFLTAFFMCIFRSNGIYVVYFCLPAVLYFCMKNKERKDIYLCMVLLMTIFSFKIYNVIIERSGVTKVPISEALSIPFQQTARYILNYPDDVTDDEKEIIQSVLQYDVIKEKYNPRLSDYVKGTYHGENKDLMKYFGVWFKQFFRHPAVYFSATFNNCFEFFYPFAVESESGLYKTTNNDENIKLFDESLMHEHAKKLLTVYIETFEKIPVLNFFCNTGYQFWLTIYFVAYAIFEKKEKLFFALIPSIVGILVCIASPTYTWNGIRYALPVIYASPIIFCVLIMEYKNKSEN